MPLKNLTFDFLSTHLNETIKVILQGCLVGLIELHVILSLGRVVISLSRDFGMILQIWIISVCIRVIPRYWLVTLHWVHLHMTSIYMRITYKRTSISTMPMILQMLYTSWYDVLLLVRSVTYSVNFEGCIAISFPEPVLYSHTLLTLALFYWELATNIT